MDKMTEEPVGRSEYEQFVKTYEVRHAELRNEIKEVEVDLKAQVSSLSGKMVALSNKMDTLSIQVSKRSVDGWKLVATSSVSIIVGYALNYVQHMFIR